MGGEKQVVFSGCFSDCSCNHTGKGASTASGLHGGLFYPFAGLGLTRANVGSQFSNFNLVCVFYLDSKILSSRQPNVTNRHR